VDPTSWFLHQAARALQLDDSREALTLLERGLDAAGPAPPEGIRAVHAALKRRADAQAIATCFPEAGTPAPLLVDLVDLLGGLPEGAPLLEQARRGDRSSVQSGLAALAEKPDLPSRLYHHLALLWWKSAQRSEDDPSLPSSPWRLAWRSWLAVPPGAEAPPESERGLLLEHLLGVHRRRINDLVARGDMESARGHWDLVQSLPSLDERTAGQVAHFRDDLATEYLLTTRESMKHGAPPEGWRADYERGLSLLGRLLSLDRGNVRLLTALVEICTEWFFDLYNLQAVQTLVEQVSRYTPFALHLARLIEDRPGDLSSRSVLSEFCKFRGFVEPNPADKIALYREALRLNPANGNVRDLLAALGVNDTASETSSSSGSDDD
jgi:hypothetical protein